MKEVIYWLPFRLDELILTRVAYKLLLSESQAESRPEIVRILEALELHIKMNKGE